MTEIPEPGLAAGETEMLLFALDRSRATFAWKSGGLDRTALSKPLPPSAMTMGGLIKHLALVEDDYTCADLSGRPIGPPWDRVDFETDPDWEWRTAGDDSPEELYALWRAAVRRSRAAWTAALAGGGLDQKAKRRPCSLRRILVDLHEEYARHLGHADLLREAIDGLTGEDPPRSEP